MPLSGRPFRGENGAVIARQRRRDLFAPLRAWISLRAGTRYVPFIVAETHRGPEHEDQIRSSPMGPSGRYPFLHA